MSEGHSHPPQNKKLLKSNITVPKLNPGKHRNAYFTLGILLVCINDFLDWGQSAQHLIRSILR